MPFQVGNGCSHAAISDSLINPTARSDIPPEMSVWEKSKAFFPSTNKSEVLVLIRQICHPPDGATRDQVAARFEKLRTLADEGSKGNVKSGWRGANDFCILAEDSRDILSVTLDNAGVYTVKCEGYNITYNRPPDIAQDYEEVWSAWEEAAPDEEAAGRADVVRELRDIQSRNTGYMNLRNLNITSLPDHLPTCIRHINITAIPLTGLPALPAGLQTLYVSHNRLTGLPALPAGLQALYVSHNRLTGLPALPAGLQALDVGHNRLTGLPPLPAGLQALYARGNQLPGLPALPAGLQELYVSNNQLTDLPELPAGLEALYVSDNQLTGLPALPAGLRELYVSDNQLTALPALPAGLQTLYVRNNPLPGLPALPAGLQALDVSNSGPGHPGPAISFSMAGPSAPREARPLHLAVADWLTPANEGEPASADRWQAFGQEEYAAAFSVFLDRLSKTGNCKNAPGFKAQMSSLLTQLAEDDELRARIFATVMDATSSCEDRVTLTLNHIKIVQLVHNAEKGKYDKNLSELVSAGREMFCLEKLEQIAWDKVKALAVSRKQNIEDIDAIEVYLGFQNRLREPLELSSVSKEMRFFGVSGITEEELQFAEVQVKTAGNSQFREWILQWAPLRIVLARAYPEDWKKLDEKKSSDYDKACRTLSDTELKPVALTGDADAERTIGARALKIAEEAFLEGLRLLADTMLGEYLKARGLN